MEKQQKQLIAMLVTLIVVVLVFFGISAIPEEEDEATVVHDITKLVSEDVTKLVYTFEDVHVKLTKSGEEWINEEDASMDLEEEAVLDMITKVAALSSENKIENVEDTEQYGLAEATKHVLISDGDYTYTLVFGDYNDMTYQYYVCLEEDMSTVYTVSSSVVNAFNTPVEDLLVEEETATEEETTIYTE